MNAMSVAGRDFWGGWGLQVRSWGDMVLYSGKGWRGAMEGSQEG